MSSFFNSKTSNEFVGFGDITILYEFLNIINKQKSSTNDMFNFIRNNKNIFLKKIKEIDDGTILHALSYGGEYFKPFNINILGFKINFDEIINKSLLFFKNNPVCINEIPEDFFYRKDKNKNTPLDISILSQNHDFKQLLCNKEGAVDNGFMKDDYLGNTIIVNCDTISGGKRKRKTRRFRNKKKKTQKRVRLQ